MYAGGIVWAWLSRAGMRPAPTTSVAQLTGLGPKSTALLARVGVHSAQDLQGRDPLALYLQLKAQSKAVSLNMLWALVGAQTNRPWQQVAREERGEWLTRLAAMQEAQRHWRPADLSSTEPLTTLRNIGPTVAKRLNAVGIHTRADLSRMGAAKAYRRMAEQAAPHHLAVCYYLYSLQGALQNRHWDELSQDERAALRVQTGLKL